MKCPNDGTTLQMSNREHIEIDYCPECRGIWLDRGELDKLVERADAVAPTPQRQQHHDTPAYHDGHPERHHDRGHEPEYRHHDYDNDFRHRDYGHGYRKKHKKESFLGEIFDF